jgi:hypothetical protein
LVALAAVGALAVGLAVRMNRATSRRAGGVRTALDEARQGLFSRRGGPGIALSSAVVLAGHVAMFVVAARVAGSAASVVELVPLAVLALVAMGLPLNVGGFGPREGVTAWAFGAAGLGASTGVAVAVVYGVLSFVASLPGAVVLIARWYTTLRTTTAPKGTDQPAPTPTDPPPASAPDDPRPAQHPGPAHGPGSAHGPTRAHAPAFADDPAPGRDPAPAPGTAPAPDYPRPVADVSSAKYGSKDSARLASSASPFSADPREGRPMTPDSV